MSEDELMQMQLWPTSSRPSLTARGVTLLRALEQYRPADERIVDDPYASTFLEPLDRALLEVVRRFPPAKAPAPWAGPGNGATSILSRHRFIDDRLQASLKGADQLLLLGAGYDSRAYRFAEAIGSRPVFEVDLPAISRRKAGIVSSHPSLFSDAQPRRVEIDFKTSTLRDRLVASGFIPGAPTFAVWEGVAMYLPRTAVVQTLTDLQELSGPGSELAMDFVIPFTGRRPRTVAAKIASQSFRLIGEPVRFGLPSAEAPAFLAEARWSVDELLQAPDLTRKYATDGRRCDRLLYVVSAGKDGGVAS